MEKEKKVKRACFQLSILSFFFFPVEIVTHRTNNKLKRVYSPFTFYFRGKAGIRLKVMGGHIKIKNCPIRNVWRCEFVLFWSVSSGIPKKKKKTQTEQEIYREKAWFFFSSSKLYPAFRLFYDCYVTFFFVT